MAILVKKQENKADVYREIGKKKALNSKKKRKRLDILGQKVKQMLKQKKLNRKMQSSILILLLF